MTKLTPPVKATEALIAAALMLAIVAVPQPAQSAVIGLNNVHWDDPTSRMGGGDEFTEMRARLTNAGHSVVSLNSFDAEDFEGLDAIFIQMPHPDTTGPGFTPSEMNAIRSFANQRAVFVSDSTLMKNTAPFNDRGLDVFDNGQFFDNVVEFVSGGNAAVFVGDGGDGFDTANFNELVAPYGVQYALDSFDPGAGRVVTGFADHPLTTDVEEVQVIWHRPLTVMSPSLDLTLGSGAENILAVWVVPEPSSFGLAALGALAMGFVAWRRRRVR